MNVQKKVEGGETALVKADPNSPCIKFDGENVFIKAGTAFRDKTYASDVLVANTIGSFVRGHDYVVVDDHKGPILCLLESQTIGDDVVGGFHFAPGGNAKARAGGDSVPAINPCSAWDRNFRPVCSDSRGKMFKRMPDGRGVWGCIYKLGRDHLVHGASAYGVEIADGDSPPQNPAGGYYDRLDFKTAIAVLAHHGLQLMTYEEASAFAYGVTERSSASRDPEKTGLDTARTSATGSMQAAGNLWDWITDGDPDDPRASIFGGSWIDGSGAGSRYANLGCYWPESSSDDLGARGRCDHLQLG